MTTIQASPAHSHAVSSAAVDGEGEAEQPGHNYDPDQSKRLECGSGRASVDHVETGDHGLLGMGNTLFFTFALLHTKK